MIKGRVIRIVILFLLCFFSQTVAALEEAGPDVDTILEEQLKDLSLENIQKVVNRLNKEMDQVLPTLNFTEMVKKFIHGGLKFDWRKFIRGIWNTLFREVLANIKLLSQLLVLAVIAALLNVFQEAFNNPGVAKLSNGFVYLLLVVIALNSFSMAAGIGSRTIKDMVDFMHALLPTLFTLLISIGAVGSATIFQPMIFLVVSLIATVIKMVVFPLISLAVVLSVVSSFTGEFRLSRLGGFIKEMGITILGLSLVIFFGVILIQGVAVSVADGISLRTAKYLTGAFVPFIGGMFADALELVVGCSLLIQNAIGLIGMLIIFITVVFPIVKILALVVIYKLISAIIQPIGEDIIVDSINNLGNTLMLVFLSVTTVAIMFFIVITIMVGIANMTVMLR
ncbi:stage III sporulation protein AE [Anoxybacter fermentans]|uniref:Stage III sporulation protein AE n=1 Tax=Anoxybacter fermentans TaxID=1323375 RepID=A0A3Q9HSL3_9FIRM|nr:stage III sporulation protein AE [Anoxybacter fermentans]AZR73547.1 stage III sporulation protein AE [Anoxybacter fermentans]